jgi:hypothetical protein
MGIIVFAEGLFSWWWGAHKGTVSSVTRVGNVRDRMLNSPYDTEVFDVVLLY